MRAERRLPLTNRGEKTAFDALPEGTPREAAPPEEIPPEADPSGGSLPSHQALLPLAFSSRFLSKR